MTKYIPTIGIECHVQLCTKTKLFSEVDNDARLREPNSCVSPVDYGLPGMLPRLNQEAVKYAVRAGLALNSAINLESRFDRKHYYYPDLPKGYQITQIFHPIIGEGYVELPNGYKVRIEHAHLEEDAGKLSHESGYSLVDLNRAGTPLVEIVSMPDIHSASEARDYTKELWRLMTYAGVTYGDLYNGNMRFDVNISIAEEGSNELGTRTEVKNLNSFRSVERAVEYEVKRQSKLLEKGEKVIQETRGWSDATGETTGQRSKEVAADYRYMPEPDLAPIRLSSEEVEAEKQKLPKMPSWYRGEFHDVLGADLVEVLLDYPQLMSKLAELTSNNAAVKKIANLFSSVLLAEENTSLLNDELPTKEQLLALVEMNEKNELSSTGMKEVFLKFFDPEMHYKDTRTIAKELGVVQENNTEALEAIVDTVLAKPETKKAQEDFKAGQEKVLGFLVGQVMKESKGKANPSSVQEILRSKLS
jgi:aspartyl-tRNA(Asn)/glutamyl-tRNA(Gln) amidotransferase subunit B